jgi:hypothetical protein
LTTHPAAPVAPQAPRGSLAFSRGGAAKGSSPEAQFPG